MIFSLVLVALALVFGVALLFGAPYVPSKRRDIELALTKLYKVSGKDVLVDVGSGDGVVLRAAAQHGARAVGYEVNPIIAVVSRALCLGNDKIHIRCSNGLKADWPADTTVVYVFGVARFMNGLKTKMAEHAKHHGHAVRLISYGFEVKGLKPEKQVGAYFLYKF